MSILFAILRYRSVYDICQPVLKQLLTTAEVPEEQMRSILEQQVRSEDDELWQLWRSIPAKAKKVGSLSAGRPELDLRNLCQPYWKCSLHPLQPVSESFCNLVQIAELPLPGEAVLSGAFSSIVVSAFYIFYLCFPWIILVYRCFGFGKWTETSKRVSGVWKIVVRLQLACFCWDIWNFEGPKAGQWTGYSIQKNLWNAAEPLNNGNTASRIIWYCCGWVVAKCRLASLR